MEKALFHRNQLLLGDEIQERIASFDKTTSISDENNLTQEELMGLYNLNQAIKYNNQQDLPMAFKYLEEAKKNYNRNRVYDVEMILLNNLKTLSLVSNN